MTDIPFCRHFQGNDDIGEPIFFCNSEKDFEQSNISEISSSNCSDFENSVSLNDMDGNLLFCYSEEDLKENFTQSNVCKIPSFSCEEISSIFSESDDSDDSDTLLCDTVSNSRVIDESVVESLGHVDDGNLDIFVDIEICSNLVIRNNVSAMGRPSNNLNPLAPCFEPFNKMAINENFMSENSLNPNAPLFSVRNAVTIERIPDVQNVNNDVPTMNTTPLVLEVCTPDVSSEIDV